jgi:hypothetical protein
MITICRSWTIVKHRRYMLTMTGAVLSITLCGHGADYPGETITNGVLAVRVYLPDKDAGAYRSTRFDWSSFIGSVTYDGHEYIGMYGRPHNPQETSNGMGPCEEYGIQNPPGYDRAKPGTSFLKIGVGLLSSDDADYSFAKRYQFIDGGQWSHSADKRRVTIIHILGRRDGYGYRLVKTFEVSAPDAQPLLFISHLLINTGQKKIECSHYCHNFFRFDTTEVGPDYMLVFPFIPSMDSDRTGGRGYVTANGFRLRETMNTSPLLALLGGWKNDTESGAFRLLYSPGSLYVDVTNTLAVTGYKVWSNLTALCAEPQYTLALSPGDSLAWTATYYFGSEAQAVTSTAAFLRSGLPVSNRNLGLRKP